MSISTFLRRAHPMMGPTSSGKQLGPGTWRGYSCWPKVIGTFDQLRCQHRITPIMLTSYRIASGGHGSLGVGPPPKIVGHTHIMLESGLPKVGSHEDGD